MHPVIDPTFEQQRETLRFRFACEDCVYYSPANDACSHGYPIVMHRSKAFLAGSDPPGTFCKEFELV